MYVHLLSVFFFFKQKPAYEVRISDWSSDVCSSDLPVMAEAASHYGITAVEMARASIVGQPVHLLSPLVPSTYLLVALAGIEFGDHQRFTLKWAVLVCLFIMFAALLMGKIGSASCRERCGE